MSRLFSTILLSSVVIFVGCNGLSAPAGDKSNPKEMVQVNAAAIALGAQLNGCFISIFKKDTARLDLHVNNGLVTGNLSYNRFEKDKNSGTIQGKIQDSLIIADYTFQSEDITTVRQVVFKINGKNLTEGFGDILINKGGDSAFFKQPTQLKFPDEQVFVRTACK